MKAERKIWYYIFTGGIEINESLAHEVDDDYIYVNRGKIPKENPYYKYFETHEEAKNHLIEYWNAEINKALDLVDDAKHKFRIVCDL